jgi:hypothetical protein
MDVKLCLSPYEENTDLVSENRMLRRIFLDVRGIKEQEAVENCIVSSFIICTLQQILFGDKSRMIRWTGHVASMGEIRNAKNL